jgi:hypothetical protein
MKKSAAAFLALLILWLLYLLFWPVPVSPVAWDAPQDRGLVDPFEPNDQLGLARAISIGEFNGPEDIAGGMDAYLYVSVHSGHIIRLRGDGSDLSVFADVGGRPLGLDFGEDGYLYVANAPLGLQRISRDGNVKNLVSEFDGELISYADDLAVAADGRVFFSDASNKFNPRNADGSYEASLLDILEHGGHGRVFEYSPMTKQTRVIMDGLNFANGRVLRHWLEGPIAGTTEVIIDNLPGFPDNVNNGLNGKYWIGLVAPRNKMLDDLSASPFIRKILQRLPAFVRPRARPSSHVIAIDGDGQILMNLQDTGINYPTLTGVFETSQSLYLTSLFGNRIGRLDKKDLQ